MEQYRQAVELAPDGAVFRANLANALRSAGRPSGALAAISNALRSDPKNAWAYNAWGNVLYGQGRYAAAVEQYRLAVELAPDDAVIHANLADALRLAGRPDEALRAVHDALEADPKYARAYDIRAYVLHEHGK